MLLWRRGVNVLTASSLMVTTDERIRLVNGYNLEITELEPQDAGKKATQCEKPKIFTHFTDLENNNFFPFFPFMLRRLCVSDK